MTVYKCPSLYDFLEVAEILDSIEGRLIDNLLFVDKDGELCVAIETYKNEWTTCYTLYVSDGSREDDLKIYDIWDSYMPSEEEAG